jgi:hypothetical protein
VKRFIILINTWNETAWNGKESNKKEWCQWSGDGVEWKRRDSVKGLE